MQQFPKFHQLLPAIFVTMGYAALSHTYDLFGWTFDTLSQSTLPSSTDFNTSKCFPYLQPYLGYEPGSQIPKILAATQAHIHQFGNLKKNLYNCNINIYFNQECLCHKIIPDSEKSKFWTLSQFKTVTVTLVPFFNIHIIKLLAKTLTFWHWKTVKTDIWELIVYIKCHGSKVNRKQWHKNTNKKCIKFLDLDNIILLCKLINSNPIHTTQHPTLYVLYYYSDTSANEDNSFRNHIR